MSVKKQKDVIKDITEQSLLTLDGVAEEITKQTVQEEVDNFIAERALKENSAEVIAIANKVAKYKKGDKTNFGVVVEVTPSSITFKAKDTPKTKIVFNQRKMGSKDYILSSLSKLNESMEDMRSMDDMDEARSQDDIQTEVNTVAKKLGLTDKQLDHLVLWAPKVYPRQKVSKGLPGLLYLLNYIDNLSDDDPNKKYLMRQAREGGIGAMEVDINMGKYEKGMDPAKSKSYVPMESADEDMEAEEETIESLAAKLELTDEQVETLAAKSNEKYEEQGDAVLLDMLKMVAIPTDEEHKSAMMELIFNGDFDALEAHIAEMKAQEESEMKESLNKQDREKLQSILKSKKFIELDEINDENQIEDLLKLQRQGFIPDDIESIYEYGNVPQYGAAVIFYPDDDGITILKGRKNIGTSIQALLKDMSIFNDIFIGDDIKFASDTKEESEMKESQRNFKKLTKDEFIKLIRKEAVNENDDEDDEDDEDDDEEEELTQEEEDAWKASDTLSNHFTYDSSEMPIKDFKYYAYKFVHIMDDANRSLSTFKSMSDEELVDAVEDILNLGLEFNEDPKFGARVIIDEQSNMKVVTTDIDELVKDEEGLTEGFKEKASIIFEAAVASKVKKTKSLLKEQYAMQLQEEVETIKETLVEKIDSYLTYAVETWVNDNKVAVESTLRTEITESFIGSLKNIFTEHYIEVPESKVNVVADMEQQLSALKEQVATKGRIANALADRVEKLTRQKVIAEASAGLADTQIAKLTELVEDVEFINEDTFAKKVSTIREFYVNRRAAHDKNTLNENVDDNASFISKETIVENQIDGESLSPSMQNYLSAMSRMNKATTANLVS